MPQWCMRLRPGGVTETQPEMPHGGVHLPLSGRHGRCGRGGSRLRGAFVAETRWIVVDRLSLPLTSYRHLGTSRPLDVSSRVLATDVGTCSVIKAVVVEVPRRRDLRKPDGGSADVLVNVAPGTVPGRPGLIVGGRSPKSARIHHRPPRCQTAPTPTSIPRPPTANLDTILPPQSSWQWRGEPRYRSCIGFRKLPA